MCFMHVFLERETNQHSLSQFMSQGVLMFWMLCWGSQKHGRKMLSRDQETLSPRKTFFEQTEFLPKDLNFYRGDF